MSEYDFNRNYTSSNRVKHGPSWIETLLVIVIICIFFYIYFLPSLLYRARVYKEVSTTVNHVVSISQRYLPVTNEIYTDDGVFNVLDKDLFASIFVGKKYNFHVVLDRIMYVDPLDIDKKD